MAINHTHAIADGPFAVIVKDIFLSASEIEGRLAKIKLQLMAVSASACDVPGIGVSGQRQGEPIPINDEKPKPRSIAHRR